MLTNGERLAVHAGPPTPEARWCNIVETGAMPTTEKQHFLDVAERLAQSKDPAEQEQLKAELARLTFGD
jgi:hypothetical protein